MAAPSSNLSPAQIQAQLQILLNGPAGVPPPGVSPNFVDPSNLTDFVILTTTLGLLVTTFALIIRIYTKAFLIRSITLDDYAIVISFLGEVALIVLTILTDHHGGGVHIWNLKLKTFSRMLYFTDIWTIVYAFMVFFVKLSILLQYLRIFVPTRKANMPLFIAIHACIWSCFVFYLVSAVFQIAMCKPREKFWDPLIRSGHCFDYFASYQASGIFNVVSDFAILILPMFPLWSLKVSQRKKIGIMAIFGTGFFTCAASILRTYYSWEIAKSLDISYNTLIVGLWTNAEIATGILICCLPVCPRFFQHFGPRITSVFSFVSRSRLTGSGPESDSKETSGKRKGSSYFKQISLKHSLGLNSVPETWARPSVALTQLNPDFVGSHEYRASGFEGSATKRNDLENGMHVA